MKPANMMKPVLIAVMALAVFGCKKDDQEYKIRYVVEGNGIEEIKYNLNNINYNVKGNFANGWDTTFIHSTKQKLELQSKAKNSTASSLTNTIYLDNEIVAKETDVTEVKIEHQIP